MVVIGIIGLLIGIALPAFSRAREAARAATTKAGFATLQTGIESYRTREQMGGTYPPSDYLAGALLVPNPHKGTIPSAPAKIQVGGANLLAWALVGADLLGTPGFRDLNNTDTGVAMYRGIAPYYDDLGADPSKPDINLYALYPNGLPYHPRQKFAEASSFKFPVKNEKGTFTVPVDTKPEVGSLCFLDAWNQPILYYRAHPGYASMVDGRAGNNNTGIYNAVDNGNITGFKFDGTDGLDLGASHNHFRSSKAGNKYGVPVTEPPPRGSFGFAVWNPAVTATYKPHNMDSYLLISAGPDAIYGTPDDVTNYETNK